MVRIPEPRARVLVFEACFPSGLPAPGSVDHPILPLRHLGESWNRGGSTSQATHVLKYKEYGKTSCSVGLWDGGWKDLKDGWETRLIYTVAIPGTSQRGARAPETEFG